MSPYNHYLFLGKIANSLSDSEERELQHLFASDEKAYEDYLSVANLTSPEQLDHFVSKTKQPDFWRDIPGEISMEEKAILRRKIIKASAISAVIAAMVLGSWIWINSINKPQTAQITENKSKKIQLTLADGKIIDLSSDTGTIQQQGLTLRNTSKELSYHAAIVSSGINTIHVPTGMDYKINLADGSEVWLNSETVLKFPSDFSGGKREIDISGEAYVRVKKDASRPFVVHMNKADVTVLGTEFNVNDYEDADTRISLVEGSVKVDLGKNVSDKKQVILKPGKQLSFNYTTDSAGEESFDAKRVLSWRQGLFYFNKASLDEISRVMQRWFGIKTIIDNPQLRSKKFVGVLDKNKSIEYFLDNLRNISKLNTHFDKEGILHFK